MELKKLCYFWSRKLGSFDVIKYYHITSRTCAACAEPHASLWICTLSGSSWLQSSINKL